VTAQIDDEVIRRLAEWKRRKSQSESYIEFHRKLLGLRVEDSYLPTLDRCISKAVDRFRKGDYLFHFEDLSPHRVSLQKLFREASSIVGEYFPGPDASELPEPTLGHPLLEKAARSWYQYHPLSNIAREMGVGEEILSLSFQGAFHPLLTRYSEVLSPLVDQDSWRQRLCPVCGGKPDFAFLTKDTGARWLMCSRCDTQWLFLRLRCPFCDNSDQDTLAYFTDENELYRLYVCERCRSYIKAIDLRKSEGETLLPLERILTLDLDRQAHEAGYEPGWIAY
jgi:FdhE protein